MFFRRINPDQQLLIRALKVDRLGWEIRYRKSRPPGSLILTDHHNPLPLPPPPSLKHPQPSRCCRWTPLWRCENLASVVGHLMVDVVLVVADLCPESPSSFEIAGKSSSERLFYFFCSVVFCRNFSFPTFRQKETTVLDDFFNFFVCFLTRCNFFIWAFAFACWQQNHLATRFRAPWDLFWTITE